MPPKPSGIREVCGTTHDFCPGNANSSDDHRHVAQSTGEPVVGDVSCSIRRHDAIRERACCTHDYAAELGHRACEAAPFSRQAKRVSLSQHSRNQTG